MNLIRRTLLLAVPALLLPACQRYEPAPLDLPAHYAAIGQRDPASPDVVAYANQLANGTTTATTQASFDPSDGLTLAEAEAVALFFNPDLRLARLRAAVPRAGAAEAGRWDDPELRVDAEHILASVQEPWVLGGTLGFAIPLSGRLGVERRQAGDEAEAAALRAIADERRLVAELRAEWARWSAAVERAVVTRETMADLDALADTTERLRQAGEAGPVDVGLARVERANQAAKLNAADGEVREGEMGLKARLGLVPAAPVKLLPDISSPSSTAADIAAESATRAAEHPRVRVARAEFTVAERTFELEVRKQYPDVQIGGGFGTDEGDERILFGGGLPIPIFNANRRAIAEARANRDVARAAAEAEHEKVMAETATAVVALDAAQRRLAFAERELAPLADRQLADARRLRDLGEFDTIVLLEAVSAARDAKLELLDARLSASLAAVRLGSLLETVKEPTR